MSNATKRKTKIVHIPITGMTCSTCAATIEQGLAKIPGVKEARVNFALDHTATDYRPRHPPPSYILDHILPYYFICSKRFMGQALI